MTQEFVPGDVVTPKGTLAEQEPWQPDEEEAEKVLPLASTEELPVKLHSIKRA